MFDKCFETRGKPPTEHLKSFSKVLLYFEIRIYSTYNGITYRAKNSEPTV